MSGISLDIVIPEYYGDYENSMRRLVDLCQNEALIFGFFFQGKFDLTHDIQTFARTLYQLVPPDVAYAIYFTGRNDVDPVREITRDLITVCQHLQRFYRANPFVSRLMQQADYLDKKISVVMIFPYGLRIEIV